MANSGRPSATDHSSTAAAAGCVIPASRCMRSAISRLRIVSYFPFGRSPNRYIEVLLEVPGLDKSQDVGRIAESLSQRLVALALGEASAGFLGQVTQGGREVPRGIIDLFRQFRRSLVHHALP